MLIGVGVDGGWVSVGEPHPERKGKCVTVCVERKGEVISVCVTGRGRLVYVCGQGHVRAGAAAVAGWCCCGSVVEAVMGRRI